MSSATLIMLLAANTAFAAMAPPAYPAPPTTTIPTYPLPGGVTECAAACVTSYRECQSAPEANRATCAAQLSHCLGYNPFDNSGTFVTPTSCSESTSSTTTPAKSTHPPPAATTTPPAKSDKCAADCVVAYRNCQGAPEANRATCAAQLSSCLGYNPFDNSGSFVTPTACSASTTSTTTKAKSTHPATTTPPPGKPEKCAAECVVAFRNCQGAPEANRATCAAQLSGCLGYNPFDNSGTFVTPTACSASSTTTTTTPPAKGTHPASTTPPPAKPEKCAADCVVAFRNCQGVPEANRATCAAQLSSCLGYNPFDNSGSFVTPTACSSSPAPTGTHPAGGAAPPPASGTPPSGSVPPPAGGVSPPAGGSSQCAADCVVAYRNCQGAPEANRATCAAQLSSCLGYNPFDNSGSFVTPTACSPSGPAPTAPSAPSGIPPQGNMTGSAPSSTYSPPVEYTGAAAIIGSSLLAVAAGAAALLI